MSNIQNVDNNLPPAKRTNAEYEVALVLSNMAAYSKPPIYYLPPSKQSELNICIFNASRILNTKTVIKNFTESNIIFDYELPLMNFTITNPTTKYVYNFIKNPTNNLYNDPLPEKDKESWYDFIYSDFTCEFNSLNNELFIALATLKKAMDKTECIHIIKIKDRFEIIMINNNIKKIMHLISFYYKKQISNDEYIMDVINFSLRMKIHENGMPAQYALYLLKNIACGVAWCHSTRICIRNLNPDNITVYTTDKYNVSVIISNLMKVIQVRPSPALPIITCNGEITHYSSPEAIQEIHYDGFAADVWSLGIIFYVMLKGTTPWPADISKKELYDQITHKTLLNNLLDDVAVYSLPKTLLKMMLERDRY